jgi:hypothetical protein
MQYIGNAMPNLSFDIDSVVAKIDGETWTIDPSEMPAVTLSTWMTYGARRWYQDHINSAAAAHRKGEESKPESDRVPFNYAQALESRHAQALDGDMTSRATAAPVNPLGKFALEVLRDYLAAKARDGSASAFDKLTAKGLADCKTTQERRDLALAALGDNKSAMKAVQARYDAAHKPVEFSL